MEEALGSATYFTHDLKLYPGVVHKLHRAHRKSAHTILRGRGESVFRLENMIEGSFV